MWCRIRYCWARRRSVEGPVAPTLPNPVNFSLLPTALANVSFLHNFIKDGLEIPYPAIDVYEDQEQAIAAAKRRTESRGIFPRAEVDKAWEKKQKILS
jgi:hypothetical protein